jgi:hypothetical protein
MSTLQGWGKTYYSAFAKETKDQRKERKDFLISIYEID